MYMEREWIRYKSLTIASQSDALLYMVDVSGSINSLAEITESNSRDSIYDFIYIRRINDVVSQYFRSN